MLLNIVTFGYTEVYPANQMVEFCDVGYTLIRGLDFVAQLCINMVSTKASRELGETRKIMDRITACYCCSIWRLVRTSTL